MRVFVYRNLNRGCWSIRSWDRQCLYGRVIAHAQSIIIRDVTFIVHQRGREKVLATRQKNVHAGVVGELAGALDLDYLYTFPRPSLMSSTSASRLLKTVASQQRVVYNPYVDFMFHLEGDDRDLVGATLVGMFENKSVRAVDPYHDVLDSVPALTESSSKKVSRAR